MVPRSLRPFAGVTIAALTAAALVGAGPYVQGTTDGDPLASFAPERRARIAAGAAAIEVLPASGPDFVVAGAVRTVADGERLGAWAREIEQLHGGKYVPLINRFSDPPRIEDLSTLVLDEDELEDLRHCRPRRCQIKLTAAEIQQIAAVARHSGSAWKDAVQQAFREAMLARALAYAQGGFAAVAPYHDHSDPEDPAAEFRVLLRAFEGHPLLSRRLARNVEAYPRCAAEAESFLYWSKDLLGDAKPIVSITHLTIFNPSGHEPMSVVGVQIFATHYLTASLSVMTVSGVGDERYLMYLRRSRTDVFDGTFGGLVRRMVNKRVRSEGPPVLDRLRRALEKGLPEPRHAR